MKTKRHALKALLLQKFSETRAIHYGIAHAAALPGGGARADSRLLRNFIAGEARYGLRSLFGGGESADGGAAAGFRVDNLSGSFDRMIATSLMQGPLTSSVLRSLFGLTPSLIGR